LPGLWLFGGAMNALGKSVEWVTDLLAPGGGADAEELLAAAFEVSAGAEGLVFLPYLAGERAPIEDRRARGVLAGLSLEHGRGHVTRAVLEAGGYALRHVAEPIRDAGIGLRRLVVSGTAERIHGAARIRADILGVPVDVPAIADTAAAGAAILAAVGSGVHPDARSAIRSMVRIDRRIEPDPASRTTYDELYQVFRALHPATATLQHRLADIADRTAEERPRV
jgi:xylulokinase